MYPSSSILKRLVLVPILVVVATELLVRSVSALNLTNTYLNHKCLVSQGKYKQGSDHDKALDSIMEKLSKDTYVHRTGFGHVAYGVEPNMAAVTLQCRADSFGHKCGSCFATAQSELRKRCLRDKAGMIWYDQCLVEISTSNTMGQINYDDNFCMPSAKNLSGDSNVSFLDRLTILGNLTDIAVTKRNKNLKMVKKPALYGAGERRIGKMMLYGMVQCAYDLSVEGCKECMTYYTLHYQDCWKSKQGVRVLSRGCYFRYELYPFVNAKTSPNYAKF